MLSAGLKTDEPSQPLATKKRGLASRMEKLQVHALKSPLAPKSELTHALKLLAQSQAQNATSPQPEDTPDPTKAEALLFATGGVEAQAKDIIEAQPHRPFLLLAQVQNNATAAAFEVQAWARLAGHRVEVRSFGGSESAISPSEVLALRRARQFLSSRYGLIGQPSAWLLASTPSDEQIRERWGIKLTQLTWDHIGNRQAALQGALAQAPTANVSSAEVRAAANLSQALQQEIIDEAQLDGVAIECFSLFAKRKVAGCIGLAELLERGIAAACEGDILSMFGLRLAFLLDPVRPPWMANLTELRAGGRGPKRRLRLAHCTVAPSTIQGLELRPHYETGQSVALRGVIEPGPITLLRLGLDLKQSWCGRGQALATQWRPDQCRTQVEVELEKALDPVLGNHHILIPGDHLDALMAILEWLR